MSIIYLDGDVIPLDEARIPINSIAFLFVGSVFETLRLNWNSKASMYYLPNYHLHIKRLFDSMTLTKMAPGFLDMESSKQ